MSQRLRPALTLFEKRVSAILYAHDLEGLAKMGAPAHEYDPEARDLGTLVKLAGSKDELARLVAAVFHRWFDPGAHDYPQEKLAAIAKDLLDARTEDFSFYIARKWEGATPAQAYEEAKNEGRTFLDTVRMLRAVYGLSLEDAKAVIIGKPLDEHQHQLAEELAGEGEEMAGLTVNSIGTCAKCGYYGPGPAHDCKPNAGGCQALVRLGMELHKELASVGISAPQSSNFIQDALGAAYRMGLGHGEGRPGLEAEALRRGIQVAIVQAHPAYCISDPDEPVVDAEELRNLLDRVDAGDSLKYLEGMPKGSQSATGAGHE